MTEEVEKKEEKIEPIIKKLESFEILLQEIKEILEKEKERDDIMKPYQLSDYDDGGDVKYYGYVKKNGDWLIKREDTTNKTVRFAKCDELWRKEEAEKGYTNAWENRESLTYFLFYEIF